MRSTGVALAILVASSPLAFALPFLCTPEPWGGLPWRDCNLDGHEGLGPARLNPYRAEILFDKTICPPAVGGPGGPGDYNDGTCVRERGS